MKYCRQCGAQLEDEMKFCVYCGAGAEGNANPQQEQNPWSNYQGSQQAGETSEQNGFGQNYQNMNYQNGNYQNAQNTDYQNHYAGAGQTPGSYHGIEQRSIPLCIILTIVTCGLYGIYWMFKLNEEINQLAGETNATSGGMVILLTIVTCGIYEWYWLYKMGERGDKIKGANSNSGILYLVIGILGLGIIDYCLIQDTINKRV